MILINTIAYGIAVFVITYLIKYTDGPFDVFSRLRDYIGAVFEIDDHDKIVDLYIKDSFIAKLIACWWCTSTWIALFLVVVYVLCYGIIISDFLVLWFGSVGVAKLLYKLEEL